MLDYGFLGAGFLAAGAFFAGAFLGGAALAFPRPQIRVGKPPALTGYCRTEVSVPPAVLNVISTRRLLARMIVREFRRIRARSSLVISGFCSTDAFTSAA